MAIVMLVLSVLCLAAMALLAESAPQEAVWVGLACYFAIVARLAQSHDQHNYHMEGLKRLVTLVRDQAPPAAEPQPLVLPADQKWVPPGLRRQ